MGIFLFTASVTGQVFHFPTANHALLEPGGEERFFVGTVGKGWMSGTFGCVRTDGWQMHEGLDILCLERDKKGEPTDPVLATAEGTVAYINSRAGLSNYGKYIILRHEVEGLEIYSLYAHLREVRAGLKAGQRVQAREPIGVLGRTSNTQQGISKERAHVHFELDLLVNERFAAWYQKAHRGERNDHGGWNGQNFIGLDPRAILLAQQRKEFSLLQYLRQQPELCRVLVRKANFPWVKRYALLVKANPVAEREGIVAFEVALNFNGVPYELIPRAASECKGKGKYQLLSVNPAEQQKNRCRRLVTNKNGRWELSNQGVNLLELLVY